MQKVKQNADARSWKMAIFINPPINVSRRDYPRLNCDSFVTERILMDGSPAALMIIFISSPFPAADSLQIRPFKVCSMGLHPVAPQQAKKILPPLNSL